MTPQEQSKQDQRRAEKLEAALLLLLLRNRRRASSRDELFERVRYAIYGGRSAARMLARNGVAALLGVTVPADPIVQLADLQRATVLARRHVLQVERQLLRERAADPKAPLRAAIAATEHRAAVLAATETYHAVAEERLRAASTVSTETGIALFKSWNSELDACPRCREVDGETVGINDRFSIGAEPGMAHAQCRCWLEILTRSTRAA